MSIDTELDLVLVAGGLTPGQLVEGSFAYVPDDGTVGKNVGTSVQKVRSNGVVRITTDFEECTSQYPVPGQLSTPGHIHAWVHAAGTGFDGPPLETPEGEASIDIPVA